MNDTPESVMNSDRGPAGRLQDLWRAGQRPALDSFLRADRPADLDQLLAVLRVDQAQRWQLGEPTPCEDYFHAHPALASDLDRACQLLLAEFHLQRVWGQPRDFDELLARFPLHADRLVEWRSQPETPADPSGSAEAPSISTVPTLEGQPIPPQFPGYEILGELGRGGMGVVHKAREQRTGQIVALKSMLFPDPALLVRFKQEFRHLADIDHPNLVRLFALEVGPAGWFFTMQLVEGVRFQRYIRGPEGERFPPTPPQLARLRLALAQLVDGLDTLHTKGILHRDLKTGNVMATHAGQIVILDFGLAVEVDRFGLHQSFRPEVRGTVVYMSPEQAACQPISPASDWYAVGVMLFEMLTGRYPFEGSTMRVLEQKQYADPPDPRHLVRGLPDDLAELCLQLLARDPAARPGAAALRARLGNETPAPRLTADVPLIGRDEQLSALANAYQRTREGNTVVVSMQGRSGAGKSALLRHFRDQLASRADSIALFGRCYHQESVPYKALDSLIDALSRYLNGTSVA